MKKYLQIILVSLLIVSLFAMIVGCDTKDAGGDKRTLKMGTNAEFPPFEFKEGAEFRGIDIDFVKAIGEELNVEIEIVDMDFDSLISALNSGNIDFIAAAMTRNPEREGSVAFTRTYYTAKQAILVKEDVEINSTDDLVGLRIGTQSGTTGFYIAEDIEGAIDNDLIFGYKSGSIAVEALKSDHIDAIIIDNLTAIEFKNRNEGLVIYDDFYDDELYAMAFRKSDTDLLEEFDAAMKKLIDNGDFQKIVDDYMHE